MKTITFICSLTGALLVGAGAGAWWSARILTRMHQAKPELEAAFHAAEEASWLADLRMGRTQHAVQDIELSMDAATAALAASDGVLPPDTKTRSQRDRLLTSVKVYRQSYPVTGPAAAAINGLLSTVPGRRPHSSCRGSVCQLDDLRLANSQSSTNSP